MSRSQLPDFKHFSGRYFNAQLDAFIQMLRSILYRGYHKSDLKMLPDDYSATIDLSWRHKTDYYLYVWFQTMETVIPLPIAQKLKDRINRHTARGLLRLKELLQLCRQFNVQELKYVVIKGPHLAQMLYGKMAVKVSVDLDFLMASQNDIDVFHESLLKMGFYCVEWGINKRSWRRNIILMARREIHYIKAGEGFAVDLHTRPFANTLFTIKQYAGFFTDIQHVMFEGVVIPVLPDEKYFVYLCHHGACHQFSRLAWLMDIRRYYETRKGSMDAEKIIELAESLKIKKSLVLAFYMMNLLFETEIPDYIRPELRRVKLYKALAAVCFRSIAYKTGDDLTLIARIMKILFMLRITKGIAGKVELIICVLMRKLVKFIR
jgi:hypothetical protein